MVTNSIAESISGATKYLTEHPEEARYTDSAAVATVTTGLQIAVAAPDGREITKDMPTGVGGSDSAPSPGWLFRAALAACDATLIAMRAAMLGVALNVIEVTVESESNDFGILGIDESVAAGPLSVHTKVRVRASDADEPALRELVEWAVTHCPVADATKRAVPMTLEIDSVE